MDTLKQALSKMYKGGKDVANKAGKFFLDDPMERADQMERAKTQRIIMDNFGGDRNAFDRALQGLPQEEDMLTSGIRSLYNGGKNIKTRLDALRQALSE